jgi:hypothetical protein
MGLSREQRVGSVCNQVAALTFRERLQVLWALVCRR